MGALRRCGRGLAVYVALSWAVALGVPGVLTWRVGDGDADDGAAGRTAREWYSPLQDFATNPMQNLPLVPQNFFNPAAGPQRGDAARRGGHGGAGEEPTSVQTVAAAVAMPGFVIGLVPVAATAALLLVAAGGIFVAASAVSESLPVVLVLSGAGFTLFLVLLVGLCCCCCCRGRRRR